MNVGHPPLTVDRGQAANAPFEAQPLPDSPVMIDVRHLSVAFSGHTVLSEVDLRLARGRCLAVIGESGAGKSVLARALVGLAGDRRSSATVTYDEMSIAGQCMPDATDADWRALRGGPVGFVLQDAMGSLDPLRTIGAEVGEALRVRGVPRAERHRRVLDALERAGLPDPTAQMMKRAGEMSGGMRQRALIASAIVSEPDLLIADEPTAALDTTVARRILELIGRVRDSGAAVLVISHDLGAVARVADDVLVLDAGRVVEYGPMADVLSSPQHLVTQRLIAAIPCGPRTGSRQVDPGASSGADHRSGGATASAPAPAPAPALALRADRLHRIFRSRGNQMIRAVDGVSLTLRPGQTLGIVGESGSGKSTLARLLLGADKPDAGTVQLFGAPWVPLPERRRRPRRSRIRLIPQDPQGSFDPRLTAEQILRGAIHLAQRRSSGEPRSIAELFNAVRLSEDLRHRLPYTMSGGQRQRLAIARALAATPNLLVLDEPVSSLDVTVQASILELLTDLQRTTGMAMIFISHDLAVVRKVCDSVAVMHAGRIVEAGQVEQVWAQPTHPVTRELLAAARDFSGLSN